MSDQYLAFIGTYTTGESEGIYTYRFDAGTGALERLSVIGGISNPSWVEISPSGRYLYAVGEESHGVIKAYAVDRATGALTYLNEQLTGGEVPCHISVDPTESYALLANYGSGSVAMLPIQADGSLGPLTGFVQHEGSSIHPVRQLGPHAHSIILDAANGLAFAPDLGIDKLLVYDLDLDKGTLAPHEIPWVRTPAGAGPRHFDIHPNGQFAYLINELASSVTVLRYYADLGVFGEIETVSTLPDGFDGETTCADIHVAPSGKFVYGSNRGHDSIAMFAIDQATGRLTSLGHESTRGQTPRNFTIDPSGTWLLAANQDTSTIVTFRIHPQTGHLHPTGQITNIPNPVCIKLLPLQS
jgi:6-phosphogluconolactonase